MSCWEGPSISRHWTSLKATGRYPSLKMPNLRLLFPPLVATGSTGPFPSDYTGHPPRSSGWWTSCYGPISHTPPRISTTSWSIPRHGKTTWTGYGGCSRSSGGLSSRQPSQMPPCTLRGKVPWFPSRTGSHSATGEGGSGAHRHETRDQNPGTSLLRVGGVLSLLHP